MSESKIRVALLWHMHQPYYKDLATDLYQLPWVRLHGLKDYYGMVAMLEEFPDVHATFNLVPSLLLQLEEYASGQAREPLQQIAFLPAEQLSLEQRLFILRYFFQANVDQLIHRYPRYRELYERARTQHFRAEQLLPFFFQQDYTDLQVLSQLAWSDEMSLAADPEISALAAKQRGYSIADQQLLHRKQDAFLNGVIPAYRQAAERGQIEISTSPFYHPILPLLCDNHVATEAHPGMPLPHHHFRHPEDAQMQLERAIEMHRRLFGDAPRGLWPSEGSVSTPVLELCASLGFRWTATDEGVLANSTGVWFHRDPAGVLHNASQLYSPYRFETPSGPIHMVFRDRELSDLIGFVYSRMEAEQAAEDLVRRILRNALPVAQEGRSVLLPIILDGENAWEHFPQNGRPFLGALYRRLSEDSRIECVTVSEGLDLHGEPRPLKRLVPGSWINANFDIWIGAPEDNRAWDLLAETRDFFEAHQPKAAADQRALAREELLIAEGSDWCWWYGPEHSTANDADFDALYRTHLANVYRALGHHPPDVFSQPIARLQAEVVSTEPIAPLSPRLDGIVSSYFEWMGAGNYRPLSRAATMHGQPPVLKELYYGRGAERFYLRIDFCARPPEGIEGISLRLRLRQSMHSCELEVRFLQEHAGAELRCDCTVGREHASGAPFVRAAISKILELEFELTAMEIPVDQPLELQLSVWRQHLPIESLPLEGWLVIPATVSPP